MRSPEDLLMQAGEEQVPEAARNLRHIPRCDRATDHEHAQQALQVLLTADSRRVPECIEIIG